MMVNSDNFSSFKMVSKKHDGSFHRSWEQNYLLHYENGILIGGNDQTIVTEQNGKQWRTFEPALFYFNQQNWFNIVIIFRNEIFFYYCNICSPFKCVNNELHYTDYDIDVIVDHDYSYKIIDEEEYEENLLKYKYPLSYQKEIIKGKNELIMMVEKNQSPFNELFINEWRSKFFNFIGRSS